MDYVIIECLLYFSFSIFFNITKLNHKLNITFYSFVLFILFRSNLDDTSDEDTDEINLSEDLSNDFSNLVFDSNPISSNNLSEPFKNTEQ